LAAWAALAVLGMMMSTPLSADESPPPVELPVTHAYQTRVIGFLTAKLLNSSRREPESVILDRAVVFDQTLSVPPPSVEVWSAFYAAEAAAKDRAHTLDGTHLVWRTFHSDIILIESSTSTQPSLVIHSVTYGVNANATYIKLPCTWMRWVLGDCWR
jgi:hypothetical protein